MKNVLKMEISAESGNENFARSAIAAFALCLNPSISELSDIKTAVSEAVTNCIVHAYGGAKANDMISIECEAEGDELGGILHIRVSDKGRGIADIEKAVQPFFTTNPEDERSGMGFTIMKTFMDEFFVESSEGEGTCVYMDKKIGERAGVNAK